MAGGIRDGMKMGLKKVGVTLFSRRVQSIEAVKMANNARKYNDFSKVP